MATPAERKEELPQLRAQFATTLSLADDTSFLGLLWSLNALQTGRADKASRFLDGFPPDAATEGILGPKAIFPWELETLANELLATPKHSYYRTIDCRSWSVASEIVNQLRALENAEYGAHSGERRIFVGLGRSIARQSPWQRGYIGVSQLYRNAFVYGQGNCAAYLEECSGLTASDMTLVGFSLLSVFYPDPAIRPASDMQLLNQLGIDRDTLSRVLDRITGPLAELRSKAVVQRNVDSPTAYKPSIMRQYPCVLVGPRARTMIAPLPDLIMDRVTNGLFYDVIGGGGVVRDEIGRRFETYCVALLRAMLTGISFEPELTYGTPLGPIASPDILMFDSTDEVQLAIECKASRMSVTARFGAAPEGDRGYEEIAKGVMQLWRYFAHCRAKVAPHGLATDVQGLILTMDEWFAGRSTVIPQIIQRANELADASAHAIPPADRRPVAFSTISELELVLKTATTASLLEAVRVGTAEKVGWIFSSIHREVQKEKTEPKHYPFEEALAELLPWWRKFDDLPDEEGQSEIR
jgi:hypothetical protein